MAQILIYLNHMKCMLAALLFVVVGNSHAQQLPALPDGITVLGTDTIYSPDILKGDTVEAVFYIANMGKQPFWILQVHASCQCTAPQYTNDTFQPGRMDSVVLFFHSKNTDDPVFEKYAIVLTPLGEKSFYIKGKMGIPNMNARAPRKIRLTNKI